MWQSPVAAAAFTLLYTTVKWSLTLLTSTLDGCKGMMLPLLAVAGKN